MAAAKDISKHFQSLRADTGRRKGRPSPFATGFEDDSDEEKKRRSRSKTKQASAAEKPITTAKTGTKLSPATDILRNSEDEFLDPPKRTDRRPSPAPATLPVSRVTDGAGRRGSLPGSPDKGLTSRGAQGRVIQVNRAPRSAVAQAAGNLAYLDDSDSDQESRSRPSQINRYPSPGPRKTSDPDPPARSSTPKGTREAPRELGEGVVGPARNSIASPFAGTKYLQDSDSDDDDEKAVSSRKSSVEDPLPDLASSPDKPRLEVKRVDKPKTQHGGGVSWRAFSEGRAEQRNQEIETLTTSLKQRGKSISFGSHALTDDGKRVPVQPSPEQIFGGVGLRKKSRGKSPPRRAEDTKPTEDEVADGSSGLGIYDPTQYKTNPFTGQPVRRSSNDNEAAGKSGDRSSTPTGSVPDTDEAGLESSTGSLVSKTTISPPQTIPEGRIIDTATSPIMSPLEFYSPLSRDSSTRSLRTYNRSRPTRIPNDSSRRNSRRSTSANPSVSPAFAFLSSWSRDAAAEQAVDPEPKPDDEGQAIGLSSEYIIGRKINQGGFGVIKEVHTINESGENLVRAVKIVRKAIPGKGELENERAQQELEHEVSIWRHLKHRNLLELHAVYDTDFATYCVMDLNVGGTLHDKVLTSRGSAAENDGRRGLEPQLAKSYSYQLACALRYLHEDIRVCHRDVKLENCLVDITVPDAETKGGLLRLCDFGLADFLDTDQSTDYLMMDEFGSPASTSSGPSRTMSSIIGTLEYASPRGLSAHRKLYETAGDMWAFGVVVYVLCTGVLPFKHALPSKTVDMIMRAEWDEQALLNAAAGGNEVMELVQGCFERESDLRLTVNEALANKWFDTCRETNGEQPSDVWQ